MHQRTITCLAIAWLLTTAPFLQAASTFYLPGTGQVVKQLDFENTSLKNQSFNYGNSWAGTGFGLSGTQRGAPEVVNVKDNVNQPPGAGNQALAFNSQTRDAAWYIANPSAVGTNVYGGQDGETQDDFFMYSTDWTTSQTPSVFMHVWLPASATYSSLRMTTKYQNGGSLTNSWPGIWLYHDRLTLRGPGRSDIQFPTGLSPAEESQSRWWTLGLSVLPDGDLQYYATPEYVSAFAPEHLLGNNSEISAQAGQPVRYLVQNRDAIIMSSNRNLAANDQTYVDDFRYTHNTISATFDDGDFNFDGSVDGADFLHWQRGLSPDPLSSSDLSVWQTNYGSPSPGAATQSVPEPSTLWLILAAISLIASRRR